MININVLLHEQGNFVSALSNTVPASSSPRYVSMKEYPRMAIVILAKNATTVTGSAITLKQATAVAGTNEKALNFTTVYENIDVATNKDALTATAVVSNTFTLDATNSKELFYVIYVKGTDLDVANGFDCVRAATADATAQTVTVLYYLYPAAHGDAQAPSAMVD